MHWKTLGLDPGQATAKDVKRTYARLLKQCRPDQAPEDFRKLHEAYQEALAELKCRAQPRGSEPPPHHVEAEPASGDASLSPEEVAPQLSPGAAAVSQALEELDNALKNELPDVAERVRACETALFENPDEAPLWGDAMHRLIGLYAEHPDMRLRPEAMLFELEHHSVAATLGVIDRLDRKEEYTAINNLSKLFLSHKDRIRTPAGGIAASRLACAAAFLAKQQVDPLSDFAYETLARGERDFHMQLIDRDVAICGLLASVPESVRNFWRLRLLHNAGAQAWTDEESYRALRWLGSPRGRRNPAFQVLYDLLPEDVAKSLGMRDDFLDLDEPYNEAGTLESGDDVPPEWEPESRSTRHPQQKRESHHERRSRSSRYEERSDKSLFALSWLLMLPILFLLKFCATYQPNDSAKPVDMRPLRIEDLRPIIQETQKIQIPDLIPEKDRETLEKLENGAFPLPESESRKNAESDIYLKLLEGSANGSK